MVDAKRMNLPLRFFFGCQRFAFLTIALFFLPVSIAFSAEGELFPLQGANWSGDVFTQGGIDSGLEGDSDALVVSADGYLGYPSHTSMVLTLQEDYSRAPFVEIEVGYRANSAQAPIGTLLWDGREVLACHPNQPEEGLLTKTARLSTTGFSFSKGSHILEIGTQGSSSNPTDLFEVDAIRIRRIGLFHTPHQRVQAIMLVTGEDLTTAEWENINKLKTDLSSMVFGEVKLVPADELTAEEKTSSDLIVVGQYSSNSLLRVILDGQGLSAPFASDPDFVQEQGYLTAVYPNLFAPGKKVWVSAGWGELGSVYGVSHLRTHFQSTDSQLYLDAEGSPSSSAEIEKIFRPDLAERAVYYNIAYGISFGSLTPDNWTDVEWEQCVDRLVCAQLTHLYFFLWGDSEVYFPPSTVCNTERNRILHERLRRMIQYAHQRGMKVTYLFSATIVPSDIFAANKNLIKATIVYVNHGFPIVCQSVPGTFSFGQSSWNGVKDFMVDIYENELEWFKEADEFQIWFYDPGGCFCGIDHHDCRGHQAERMMEQVTTFEEIILAKNPSAKMAISLWPVWALESEYGVNYRNTFLDSLKSHFASRMDRISVVDSVDHADSALIQARARGFRLDGFVFQTNVETGYPFLLPLLKYLKNEATYGASRGVSALYCMRIEEGSKFPNTYFASRYFWNKNTTESSAVRDYAQWVANTHKQAADELFQALTLLDTFTTDGASSQDLETKGTLIRQHTENALALLPYGKQQELEWLLTTSKAMEILGKAVEHPGDAALQNTLRTQFSALMLNSTAFGKFAPWASSKFSTFVQWLSSGWWSARF
jgi:hypothetical protein